MSLTTTVTAQQRKWKPPKKTLQQGAMMQQHTRTPEGQGGREAHGAGQLPQQEATAQQRASTLPTLFTMGGTWRTATSTTRRPRWKGNTCHMERGNVCNGRFPASLVCGGLLFTRNETTQKVHFSFFRNVEPQKNSNGFFKTTKKTPMAFSKPQKIR